MPRSARFLEPVLVVLGLSAVTLAATFPLVLRLGHALPGDLGDPLLNAWILGWDADRLGHGLRGLWDAPILFPTKWTLAYSEHLLGVAVFVAPICWLSGNAVLAYNVAFLAAYVLAGGGMYLLARELTRDRTAAVLAALIYAFGPFRAEHISHLQVLMSGWMPISLWGLHRFLATRSRRALAVFAGAFVLQALSNGYFLYYLALAAALITGLELARQPRAWRAMLLPLAAAGAIAIAVLSPVILAYLDVRYRTGLSRGYGDLVNFSADVRSYLKAAEAVRLWRWLPGALLPERQVFPGAVALMLAAAALVPRRKDTIAGDESSARERQVVVTYATLAAAAFLLSLGPEPRAWGVSLGPVGPYRWLARIVPGMDGLRAPARLAVLVSLGLSVLAAVGASRLFRRAPASARRAGLVLMCVAAIADGWAAPIRLVAFDPAGRPDNRSAYDWLKRAPGGAVLELPIIEWGISPTLVYQFGTLTHGHPIVNGYSGYGSSLQEWLGGAGSPLRDLPRLDRALRALGAVGIRFVVIHQEDYDPPATGQQMLTALGEQGNQIAERHDFGRVTVFQLKEAEPDVAAAPQETPAAAGLRPIGRERLRVTASPAPERVPALTDDNLDTRWLTGRPQDGSEWIRIDFDRPATVARLQIRMARRSYGDYPRDLLVEAIEPDGHVATLFTGDVILPFMRAVIADGAYPAIDLTLPPHEAVALVIRQRGVTRTWFWSVHELALWER